MDEIILTKQQVNDLAKIYEHFKTYEDFNVTLDNEGTMCVKLDSKHIAAKIDKSFVPKY